jgi:hypothetical protein
MLTLFIQKLIDIIETVYRGASKGRGLVVSPKGEYPLSGPLFCTVAASAYSISGRQIIQLATVTSGQ